ncbi:MULTISPECIES: heme NO-binding domain-containing protein [unclassified Vibrio]|uniref:heme NO-binding domain-containing protein n=1 Tax=unclassified Vibrio TaxID=2614977 RepID=UPI001360DCE0|nr:MULTISPECIES: heme NO-binding domain-containing protein [unclassified Vibrio]NAW57546.1 guanylate cyclase [Vibrio sp. V36_P2S2PM302]NAX22536.1 guanylate cyclase [Vibrio sp. V39_P1S14PM300]NAX27940.1 guanylate cyclase [Vibrio sp. V38_P2S17PM301]NAX28881.1 guanylate cyclase [Vibrio sp. V37_P2S8PM304]
MKGIIFTEFMDLVEEKFGLEVLDTVLRMSANPGAYTSVGSYDHRELVRLIQNLSQVTGVSAEQLQQLFGRAAFDNLYLSLPSNVSTPHFSSCFAFIRHVEEYIHLEVKKLYPDAKPPRFEFISESQSYMEFDYRSARCLAHVCFGLIKGCAAHFGERVDIVMTPQSAPSHVRFALTLV